MKEVPSILLFKGRGFISRLIRWQTRSQYSHAAIMLPCGRVLEAWQGEGVRIKWLRDWCDVDRFRVTDMTEEQWETAIAFARAQIGKKYDYRGVWRFLSRRKPARDDRWFCSELVFASLAAAGVKLLAAVDIGEVSPGMLAYSHRLEPYDQRPTT